jgi:hypothetical protein
LLLFQPGVKIGRMAKKVPGSLRDFYKALPDDAMEFFRKQGAKGGKMGAKARMEKVSPERRSEIAKKAVAAREAKRKKKKPVQ